MPIEDRNLTAGTELRMAHKGNNYACTVVESPEGLRYRLEDGSEFRSPSSAAKHLMGTAANGWRAWSIAGTEKPKREPKAKAKEPAKTKKAPSEKKPRKAKSAKKGKAHRAAATSNDSYGCGVCGETFPTMKAVTEHALAHTT